MNVIYKYPIPVQDLAHVSMPKGAQILSANLDNDGKLCVWAMVNTDNPKHLRALRVAGTGNPIDMPHMWTFISTVTAYPFMWHVFAFNYEGGEMLETK